MSAKKTIPKKVNNNLPLLLLLFGAIFFFLFYNQQGNVKKLTQPEFEEAVQTGKIKKVVFVPTNEYEGGGKIKGELHSLVAKPDSKVNSNETEGEKDVFQKFVVNYVLDINSIKKLLDSNKVLYDVKPDNGFLRDFVIFFPTSVAFNWLYLFFNVKTIKRYEKWTYAVW